MPKNRPLYNWIAEVARLIPGATFTPPSITYRDARTRIRVVVNGKGEHFVVAGRRGEIPDSPLDVIKRFTMEASEVPSCPECHSPDTMILFSKDRKHALLGCLACHNIHRNEGTWT